MIYYDLPLSATRRPTRRELLQLIDLLETCSYPLLIHCKSGADRTGLASALYRLVRRGGASRICASARFRSSLVTSPTSEPSTSTSRFKSMPPGSRAPEEPIPRTCFARGSETNMSRPIRPQTRRWSARVRAPRRS